MPINRCTTKEGKRGWRWGKQHCYPTREGAEKQRTAIYANGYEEKKAYDEDNVAIEGACECCCGGTCGCPAEKSAIDDAAHEAATSPNNDLPEPSEAQKESGNYKKGHITLHGLDISIENPAGSKRRPEWPPLNHHYGYIKDSVGKDKEHIDVFLGENAEDESLPIFIVDQVKPDDADFDEHKVLLGFATEEEAEEAYLSNYEKGWQGIGWITELSLAEFKDWLKRGDTTKPAVEWEEHMQKAVIIEIPVIVKARTENGRRLVSVEASNEAVDSEGDVILQKALLDSAKSFLAKGHIDIDHFSEIGHRIGIKNPSSYIIGRPVEVNDLGGGRTEVVAEIAKAKDGSIDTANRKYDEFWESLQQEPPVSWRASIYGFPKPGMLDDCTKASCTHGATRYLVKGIDWKSLAFTQHPVNDAIEGFAQVVTAKAFIEELRKGMSASGPPVVQTEPKTMDELYGIYKDHISVDCPCYEPDLLPSYLIFRNHFIACEGLKYESADIYAHALAHFLHRKRLTSKSI